MPRSDDTGEAGERPEQVPASVKRSIVYAIVALGIFVGVVWLVFVLEHLLILLILAMFISFALEPAVNFFAGKGLRRGVATGLVFLAFFAAVALTGWLFGALVVNEVVAFVQRLPELLANSAEFLNTRFNVNVNPEYLVQEVTRADSPVREFAGDFASLALDLTGSVLGITFDLFTIGLFGFYFTAEGPKLRRTICSFLPSRQQEMVLDVWEVAISKTGSYIYSRSLLALMAAVATGVFLAVMGVPYTVALAIWMGITSQFIPTVGTYIGGAAVVLIAFFTGFVRGLIVLIFIIVYQQIENYVFAPRITAKTMDIHPAVAFGSVIAGAILMGPVGALVAIPGAAVIQAIGSTYFRRHEVIDSQMTEDGRGGGINQESPRGGDSKTAETDLDRGS